jgi:hypothetical protein
MTYRTLAVSPFDAEIEVTDDATGKARRMPVRVVGIVDDFGTQRFLTMSRDAEGKIWPGRHDHVFAEIPQ